MVLSDLIRVKRFELWLIGDAVLQLTHTPEDTRTVSLVLATLATHTKLNRKPVNCCETLQLHLSCTEGSQTNFLRKICELLMRKHRGVTHQLVDDVGLRGVKGLFVMSDVLC